MMDRVAVSPPTSVAPLRPLPVNGLVFFFYRRWPQWFAPKRVCSWCPAVMRRGGTFSGGKVSHGICQKCSQAAMKSVRENLPHLRSATLAFLFFLTLGFSSCEQQEAPAAPSKPVMHAAVAVATPPETTQLESVEVIP